MTVDKKWKLQSIKIDFMEYGEDKGKYAGKIEFSNKEDESFVFKLRPEMVRPYLNLIGREVVSTANELGEKLINQLGLGDYR